MKDNSNTKGVVQDGTTTLVWVCAVYVGEDKYGCTGKARRLAGYDNAWVFIFDGEPEHFYTLHQNSLYFGPPDVYKRLGIKPFKKKSKEKKKK